MSGLFIPEQHNDFDIQCVKGIGTDEAFSPLPVQSVNSSVICRLAIPARKIGHCSLQGPEVRFRVRKECPYGVYST